MEPPLPPLTDSTSSEGGAQTSPAAASPPPPPPGTIVWCKVAGYPWWPAKLLSHPSSSKVKARFFETGIDVILPALPAAVVRWESKTVPTDEAALRKFAKKPSHRKLLALAVQQASAPGAAEVALAEAEAEAEAARQAAELAAAWRHEGHEHIGKRVARPFGKSLAYGTITRWVSFST